MNGSERQRGREKRMRASARVRKEYLYGRARLGLILRRFYRVAVREL